jgi:hypothetical protein
MRYDAHKQPDPQAWLELDESERTDLGIDDGLGSRATFERCPLFVGLASDRHRHGGRRGTHTVCRQLTHAAQQFLARPPLVRRNCLRMLKA